MTDSDIFDLLREGDPAAHHTLPDAESPLALSIRATVMANTHTIATGHRRRRAIVIAIVVALLATAAAWVLANRNVTNPEGILCYDAPSLDANAILASRDGEATTDVCATLWADQTLPIDTSLPKLDDPSLIGCVTATGTLAVFPSTNHELCAELGLAEPADTTNPDPLIELRQRLTESINPETCLTTQQAHQTTQNELNELNLPDWTVQTQPEHPDRPCTSIFMDTTTNTINIVPIPQTTP